MLEFLGLLQSFSTKQSTYFTDVYISPYLAPTCSIYTSQIIQPLA